MTPEEEQSEEDQADSRPEEEPQDQETEERKNRQPIVSILGHVDHGKTSLLDYIRKSSVMEQEAGRITQHIGASEVSLDVIQKLCDAKMKLEFNIPGLLFIDTPGHHSFATLRARGGALADIAILIIDLNEGLKPQTKESIQILKNTKTPFVIAMNKIDVISGWNDTGDPIIPLLKKQLDHYTQVFNHRYYKLIGQLHDLDLPAALFYEIDDFTQNIAMVPISAKEGNGIPELLTLVVGLAQRYLKDNILYESGPGRGTVLEVKEEKGLGKTMDVILYKGILSEKDTIVVGANPPIVTTIKAILRGNPASESAKDKYIPVREVTAAAGIKIAAPGLEDVISGSPMVVVVPGELDAAVCEVEDECKPNVTACETGIIVKADTIGSLEAIVGELEKEEINVKKPEIGDISRKDVIEAATNPEPMDRIILGFNVKMLEDAVEQLKLNTVDARVLTSDVIYKLLEDYMEFRNERRDSIKKGQTDKYVHPGKILIMTDKVFRISKPAIVGVRVLGGRIALGNALLREDGRSFGKVKSIRDDKTNIDEAIAGMEVAVAIEGVTVGRQFTEEDVLYVDIPAAHACVIRDFKLNSDEREILEHVCEVKRKHEKFWGM